MAGCNTKRMKAGGPTGMHKMPDGTMMKGAKHGYKAGGKVRGCGVAQRGLTKGRMV